MSIFRQEKHLIDDQASKLRNAAGELDQLRAELDRNVLVTQALWELLKTKMALTDPRPIRKAPATTRRSSAGPTCP